MRRLGDREGPAGREGPLSAARRWRVSSVVRAKLGANVSHTNRKVRDNRSVATATLSPAVHGSSDGANRRSIRLSTQAGKKEHSVKSRKSARANSSTAVLTCPTVTTPLTQSDRTGGRRSDHTPRLSHKVAGSIPPARVTASIKDGILPLGLRKIANSRSTNAEPTGGAPNTCRPPRIWARPKSHR